MTLLKLAPLAVLSDPEIAQIHEATLDILCNCGVHIGSQRTFGFLAERGLPADPESRIVRFTREALESALESVPRTFAVSDRTGRELFVLGDGTPRIAAGHNAVFWIDSDSGRTRASTVEDVRVFARLCDQLPVIDMIGIPVMPQDVHDPQASLLHGVAAVMQNSAKPVFFSTDRAEINKAILDMLGGVFEGDITEQVYGITQLSPTSPLYWEESVLDAIDDSVRTAVPIAILPEPNAGVSAPLTLAGLLTVNNAECLSGIAIVQMLDPGHKVLYANSWTTTDMRTGAALVGSIETSVCRIAGAQMARFYNIPSHTTAPNSDNHAHDEQNAWEKTFSTMAALGAGNDLIVNCGMFATGMTCSHEQLLMDAEISEMARRLSQGVDVRSETIATDLIRQIGPRGSGYLTADHTLDNLRSGEYITPNLAVRGPRASWESSGSKTTYDLAREQVQRMARCPGTPLSEVRASRLNEILSQFGGSCS